MLSRKDGSAALAGKFRGFRLFLGIPWRDSGRSLDFPPARPPNLRALCGGLGARWLASGMGGSVQRKIRERFKDPDGPQFRGLALVSASPVDRGSRVFSLIGIGSPPLATIRSSGSVPRASASWRDRSRMDQSNVKPGERALLRRRVDSPSTGQPDPFQAGAIQRTSARDDGRGSDRRVLSLRSAEDEFHAGRREGQTPSGSFRRRVGRGIGSSGTPEALSPVGHPLLDPEQAQAILPAQPGPGRDFVQ